MQAYLENRDGSDMTIDASEVILSMILLRDWRVKYQARFWRKSGRCHWVKKGKLCSTNYKVSKTLLAGTCKKNAENQ